MLSRDRYLLSFPRNPRFRAHPVVYFVSHSAVLALCIALASLIPRPAHAAEIAQTTPETVLDGLALDHEWVIGGGFIYWYEGCFRPGNPTHAFLNRRAVNGAFTQNLIEINDAGACETLLGPAVDESGFYYYNRSAGAIEAIYSDTPTSGVVVVPEALAQIGQRPEVGFGSGIGHLALDSEYVYWIEIDAGSELLPDEVHIRRVSKFGGEPETLLTYEASFAGHALAVNDDWILWTDSDGLQGMRKATCPGNCSAELLHEAFMNTGGIALNDAGDIVWWNRTTPGGIDGYVYHTQCPVHGPCQTQPRYELPENGVINVLLADEAHIYWVNRVPGVSSHLMRLSITGGEPDELRDGDLSEHRLGLDSAGVYFAPFNQQRILRLPLDAEALQRTISFRGWEVTQAVQNLENDAPLVAGKETFVRVYPELVGNANSAGVEAILHGERDGEPLPGSPLRPINGAIPLYTNVSLALQRTHLHNGWLFRLPDSWTKTADEAIPLQDAELTLRAELDPRGLIGTAAPGDNIQEATFTFTAKAPTCFQLREVWTEARPQAAWDVSVQGVMELAESVHPTSGFLPFPHHNRLERTEWCRVHLAYGPYCTRPYQLNEDRSRLMRTLWRKDVLGSSPSICRETGARTIQAGIVPSDTVWSYHGYALLPGDTAVEQAFARGNALLSKVPRYGQWSWPMDREARFSMTFAHEVGHNFNRLHVPCEVSQDLDDNYPYDPCMLDDNLSTEPGTYFGFDTRLLETIHPEFNVDFMSYSSPKWVSDYTWRALFDRTRLAGPLPSPFATDMIAIAQETPAAYLLVSGLITPTLGLGELSSTLRYPTAEANANLLAHWAAYAAEPWSDEPYHVRLLGGDGEILADKAVFLHDTVRQAELEELPFNLVVPAPDAPVQTIQLLHGETVLDSYEPSANVPELAIVTPLAGVIVEDDVVLEWTGTDPDGAHWLDYTIQYSPDNGENWYALVVEQPGIGQGVTESLRLELRGRPGSDGPTARLRVLASDGYNTAIATSEAFTVLPRVPEALITVPEAGRWFAAHEPVSLHGTAFDAEDGALNDDAFVWSLAQQEYTGPRALVSGLAPGAYSAELTVTDADGQHGSAAADFHIAPLDVPLAADLTLDGRCDDPGYGDLSLPLSPYANGDVAYATVARTADYLWVCLQGLSAAQLVEEPGQAQYAGFQLDVDNSQAATVQPSDLGFFVRADGTPVARRGDGAAFAPHTPTGLAVRVHHEGNLWHAELRLHMDVFDDWNRRVGLGIGHYLNGSHLAVWPHAAEQESPQSWAETNLAAGHPLALTALAPLSATVGSSLPLTVTGENFQPDTVVLWNGAPVPTTHVDGETLRAMLDAADTQTPGFHEVQVAPGDAPHMASMPRPFLLVYGQPQITGLTPDAAPMASDGLTLGVEGDGFVSGATVLWNGEARATTFVSSTRLDAEIPAQDLEAGRTIGVTVANPEPSLGPAASRAFTVQIAAVDDAFRLFVPGLHRE